MVKFQYNSAQIVGKKKKRIAFLFSCVIRNIYFFSLETVLRKGLRGAEMLFNYRKNRSWAENLSIVMQIGLTMAGCICFCFFIGLYLDRWLHTKGILTVIFTLLGVAGGGNVAYRQILEIVNQDQDDPRKRNDA